MSDEVTRVYTPKPCQGEKALFEGHVVLKVPSYEQRLEMLAAHPEIIDESQNDDNGKLTAAGMTTMLSMIKWSYQFYSDVKISRLDDKQKFKSLSDLKHSADCQGIIQDIATNLSKGFSLGK